MCLRMLLDEKLHDECINTCILKLDKAMFSFSDTCNFFSYLLRAFTKYSIFIYCWYIILCMRWHWWCYHINHFTRGWLFRPSFKNKTRIDKHPGFFLKQHNKIVENVLFTNDTNLFKHILCHDIITLTNKITQKKPHHFLNINKS